MSMRQVHRWIMTVVVLLTVYWSVSGLTLAIYDLRDRTQSWALDGGGHGPAGANAGIARLPADQLVRGVNATAMAARALAPGSVLTAVTLRMRGGTMLGEAEFGGPGARLLVIDPVSGRLLRESRVPGTFANLHSEIKDWHRGNIIGNAGIWLALLTGVALIGLIVTGTVLYGMMYWARLGLGRRTVFW